MMDDQQREWIQAGVDGELGAEDRQALDALLESSAEAQAFHDELTRLSAFLDQVPRQDPPDGFHAAIVDRVQLPQPARFKTFFSFSDLPGFLRYGLAATAAVLVTVAVYRAGSELDADADYGDLVGTIARGGPVSDSTVVDRFEFDHEGARGHVWLLERKGVYALEFELHSDGPVQFDVDFSRNGLVFDAFAGQDHDLDAVSWSGGVLSARARGDQRFVVLMRPDTGDREPVAGIGLEIIRGDAAIARGELDITLP